MAEQKERFLDAPLDRTPYGACVWVAIITFLFFILASIGLWKLGGYLKQQSWFHHPSVPHLSAPSDDQLMKQIQEATGTVQNKVGEKAQDQQKVLENAAQQEIKVQVQAQTDAAKQSATQNLNQYLNH